MASAMCAILFFFNDTATTEIYTLSLHDALPIFGVRVRLECAHDLHALLLGRCEVRSEEHTSELQSQSNLVCRLLLEKKKIEPPTRSTQAAFMARAPPASSSIRDPVAASPVVSTH